MIPATKPLLLICSLPVIFAGCTTTNPSAAFNELTNTVAARTGHRVQWLAQEREREEVQSLIRAALQTNLTAESAATIALLNNRSLQAQFEELGISQAELAQAARLRNPTLSGFARFPTAGSGVANLEGELTQDLLDLLTLPARKRIASANLEATKLRVAHAVLHTAAEAKTAFYTVQAYQQLLTRLQAIVEVNEAGADLSTRQHKAGNISDLELANQAAVFQQAKAELGRVTAQLRSARERLNRALGLWGDNTQWTLADSLPALPEKDLPLEHLESIAIQQRSDLAAARTQVSSLLAALRLRGNLRYLPAVSVGVNAERETDRSLVVGPTLDLELPLFDQGQPALAKLLAQYRQAQWQAEALATDIRADVRQARDSMIAARDLATFYEKIYLPQRIRIVNETLLQYNAMQARPLDLVLAKERELSAEREYVDASRDYWIARAELEKAIGGRLPGDIGETGAEYSSRSPGEWAGVWGNQTAESSNKPLHK
jgi:cobalt-zinc-cadmium efflux system outer membrane protein